MVAKVISGKNIRGALNYNENKVKAGVATCLLAHRFGMEAADLSFASKLNRFTNLIQFNPKVKTNTLHISLNFDPSENLSTEKLQSIANSYMNKIGFADQPYLVYRHSDAAHPHIHILSTTIKSSGDRIDIHNLGRTKSEVARKEIEESFGLVRAQSKAKTPQKPDPPVHALYGKMETKRMITNSVYWVSRHYRYTSLPELNAALLRYNVVADRGAVDSQMFRKGGLQFSLLSETGAKIGVPIKASALHSKPTLKWLQNQFKLNQALRQPYRQALKDAIDESLPIGSKTPYAKFIQNMRRRNVHVVLRQNDHGVVYGITFVDHASKSVFNGSDLGKTYSANSIFERIDLNARSVIDEIPLDSRSVFSVDEENQSQLSKAVEELITAKQEDFSQPFASRRKKKKKVRRTR